MSESRQQAIDRAQANANRNNEPWFVFINSMGCYSVQRHKPASLDRVVIVRPVGENERKDQDEF